MRRYLFGMAFIVVMAAPVLVIAQQKTTDTTLNGAKFSFKGGDTYDFGVVPVGPDVTHDFVFTNTGKVPLIITDAKPSCSCTTPEWPKEPIAPGKTGIIKVGYHAAKPGVFMKEVYLQSNAVLSGGERRYVIYIKGEVK